MSAATLLALRLALELGYLIALPLVILALAGRWLDNYYQTSPLGIFAGLILALLISTWLVLRKIKAINSANSNDDKN